MIFGLITGILLHEVRHACATLACGGEFFEIGIGFLRFVPMGYTLIDTKRVKSRFQRVRVNLAGVETNIFLCGFVVYSVLFAVEQIVLGIITRFFYRKQYKLFRDT